MLTTTQTTMQAEMQTTTHKTTQTTITATQETTTNSMGGRKCGLFCFATAPHVRVCKQTLIDMSMLTTKYKEENAGG